MLKIRLSRKGRKNLPFYHIIVIPAQNKREGKFIEKLGYYNPLSKENRYKLNLDRFDYYIKVGAQPTDIVKRIATAVK